MSLLENLAAEGDYRTTASDERWWTRLDGDWAQVDERYNWRLEEAGVTPRYEDDEIVVFSTRFTIAVCPACNGRGQYVNPSIDAHGLSREDFDEDPDFAESYFRGDYDVRCGLCQGENVVPVPLDPTIAAAIDASIQDIHQMRAEMLAEQRFGA